MSTTTKTPTGYMPLNDPVSIAYTVSNIMNIALAYHSMATEPSEKEYAESIVWSMVNKWLEEVGPLKYMPGLVEEVASLVKKKLWEAEISEDVLEHLIVDTVIFREKALMGEIPEVLNALAESLAARAEILVEALGGKIVEGTLVSDIIYGDMSPDDKVLLLVSLIGLLLVISTNR